MSSSSATTTSNIDMTDPKLQEAWKDLTNEKSATNWIIFGFVNNNTEKLEVVEVGTTGMKGLKTKLKSINSRALFGAFNVTALDKRGSIASKRPKFVAYSYIGDSCSEMQRANSSFQKNKVMQFFSSAHMTIDISGKSVDEFLNEKYLGKRLHLSTAAHKPTHYNFGDAKDWSFEECEGQEEEDDEFRD